jgi:cytochrome c
MNKLNKVVLASGLGTCLIAFACAATAAPDAEAAKSLLSKEGCLMCHAIDGKKVGPSYTEVGNSLKGKPDAEQMLIKHLTVPNKVKVMGEMVDHPLIKDADPAAIKNLVDYILSL